MVRGHLARYPEVTMDRVPDGDIFVFHEHVPSNYRTMVVRRVPAGSPAEVLLKAQTPFGEHFNIRTVSGADLNLMLRLVEESFHSPIAVELTRELGIKL